MAMVIGVRTNEGEAPSVVAQAVRCPVAGQGRRPVVQDSEPNLVGGEGEIDFGVWCLRRASAACWGSSSVRLDFFVLVSPVARTDRQI